MRIDIPPDLKEEVRRRTSKGGRFSIPESPPEILEATCSSSTLGGDYFQALFQNVYDGAIIAEPSGQIRDVNVRLEHFLLQSREKLAAMNLVDIVSGITTETLSRLQAGIEKDRFVLMQAYCIRSDNTLFPAEIAVNRLQIMGHAYLCLFIRDTSWRQQAAEMLRTVHAAIQNSATGIAIADLTGRIEYINLTGARLWGRDNIETVMGLNLRDLIPDEELVTAMINAIHNGNRWNDQLALTSDSRAPVHVQMAVAPNFDEDEMLIGMVISFLDVSDRIRANQAEQQADRQRVMVESLGAACHHLGQPATVLMSSIELLGRVWKTDKGMTEELLAASATAAESLRTILHNLNDLTEYRTTTYLGADSETGRPESRILDVTAPLQ